MSINASCAGAPAHSAMDDRALDVVSEEFDADACLSVSDPSTVKLPCAETKALPKLFTTRNLVPPAVRAELEAIYGKPVRCLHTIH